MISLKTVEDIIKSLEAWISPAWAMAQDRVGLIIGSPEQPVDHVMIALDVTEDVVREAIEKNVQLIVAHHSPLFHPATHILTHTPEGRLTKMLLAHDIAVYVMHTNFDVAPGGMNDLLAARLELQNVQVLEETWREKLYKLSVFVPLEARDRVFMAMGNAGAGHLGHYSHCTFQSEGTGTFWPRDGAMPAIGTVGELTRVSEVRIETIVPEQRLQTVIEAMIAQHPYEEVAYDLYPLANSGAVLGLGRIGELQQDMTLLELAEMVKTRLHLKGLRMVGQPEQMVRRVAVLGGSGAKYMEKAWRKGVDVMITGDVDYHDAMWASARSWAVIDAGHHLERIMKESVRSYLENVYRSSEQSLLVSVSEREQDPFHFVL